MSGVTNQSPIPAPIVDNSCIGCGICPNIANQTFAMVETDDGLKSEVTNPQGNSTNEIQQAIDMCPVTAIRWSEIHKEIQKNLRN